MLYHVVAMAQNRVIGKNNQLPWHFSSDLKHFKALTTGSTVLMGRRTFESIGRPLGGRANFVLSRTAKPVIASERVIASEAKQSALPTTDTSSIQFFSSIDAALAAVKTKDCFIIGGAELYKQTLDRIDGVYLTLIPQNYEGDVFYPEIPSHFREKSHTVLQENPKIEVIFYENPEAKK